MDDNSTSGCFNIKCDADKKSYKVLHDFEDKNNFILCSQAGEEYHIESTEGTLICEDPEVICSQYTSCVDDCNHQ